MKWSFSAHSTFHRCQRQWFYKKIFANWKTKDTWRREAHRLSKLETIQAWRGKLVDTVISRTIIPSIVRSRSCSFSEAERTAKHIFDTDRAGRILAAANEGGIFFEMEYGLPLTEDMFVQARAEVNQALMNFYSAKPIWDLIRQAQGLFPQRSLMFTHGDATVQVVPDLIMFRGMTSPVIFDWKVNTRPLRDYWLQLVTGAIALTRCNPHRDWPCGSVPHRPHDVELVEVQLLTGDVRSHKATSTDIEEAEDFISVSLSEMQFACGDEGAARVKAEDFAVARDPRTCQLCSFRKLCWGGIP